MRELMKKYADSYALSISATTRNPRPGETDGVEYFFRTKEQFEQMIKDDALIEYAQFVGNYYGTPKAYVEEQLEAGKDVILEIEIQGALKVKEKFPDTLLLFVTPPSAEELKNRLVEVSPSAAEKRFITGGLVSEGDTVLLVMPQDIQAPEGRLILPQVQTIRELLDKKCLVMSATTDKMEQALEAMAKPPKLIITDSQVYKTVYEKKPEESSLTSFSTLFAAYKGDIHYYVESAKKIEALTEDSKVLIAECCTHAPLKEDIGREKLPRFLRKRVGSGLGIDIVSGSDFPEDLSSYDLVIQCGACMFNRKYVMSRILQAKEQKVPMSNYGIVIAYLNGILDKITIPEE